MKEWVTYKEAATAVERNQSTISRWVKAEAWDEAYDANGYLGVSMNSNPYRTEQA